MAVGEYITTCVSAKTLFPIFQVRIYVSELLFDISWVVDRHTLRPVLELLAFNFKHATSGRQD
jgi:hypothetical protein